MKLREQVQALFDLLFLKHLFFTTIGLKTFKLFGLV